VSDQNLLSGIRVIDCGTYIAAPAAAVVMSDFGAEVIKIERPPYGDPYRYLSLVPGMPVSDEYYCWTATGRNKKSVALNLESVEGRAALLRLVATADVFVTNYQSPLLSKFRLAEADLRPLNPRLIYAHLTGYGETGPDAERPGFDVTAYWARSGLMSAMHNAGCEPCQSVAGFGDHPTSMTVFAAIMLGLYRRQITGQGMHVSTSLMANGAWSNFCGLQAAFAGAQWLPRWSRSTVPNPIVNHYVTRDGKRFMICCLDPKHDWAKLCRALERPDLIGDSRFSSPESRRANAPALVEIIDREVAEKDMEDWIEILRQNDVVWGPVPTTDEVSRDPQMHLNGVFPEIEPGKYTVASPINVAGVEKVKPRHAPEVGADTVETLRSLGYSNEAIEELIKTGAAC
jgi:crotonobetainyl-CoA:carnitine CoA-transferase CaiB-like acyl-CoA transferase